MSAENVEIARAAYSAFNTGNWGVVLELYHPEVQFRDLQHPPDLPEVHHGYEGLARALEQWTHAYDEFSVKAHEYIDAGPWVVVVTSWRGKGKGSDLIVEQRYADALRIVDGKVVEWVLGYSDAATALEAVG